MNKMNNKNMEYDSIRFLTERFFDGETSVEEEQRLYAFFEQHPSGLPEDMEANREVLVGFGAIGFGKTIPKEKPLHRNRLWWASGIAATLLLCIGIAATFHLSESRNLARNYEGSYVIINGQRIDDLSRIKPDIEKALSQASHIELNLAERPAVKSAEQDVLDNIADPAEKARIEELLYE